MCQNSSGKNDKGLFQFKNRVGTGQNGDDECRWVDLQIDQLSGGYKAVLSVVADIAKRLSMANPDSQNPLEEDAVILIDELDLHFTKPKWWTRKKLVD